MLSRVMAALLAATFMVTGVSACGGGGGIPGDAVAQVGSTAITKAALNRWMSTLAGGDFFELSHITAPAGLVSDPPHYSTCVARLEKVTPNVAESKLTLQCQQLYRALKLQALSYLLTAQQTIAEDAERGITASEAEIQRDYGKVKAELFPTEADLKQYLAERDWTLSVEKFLIKRNVLSEKLARMVREKFKSEQAMEKYLLASNRKWVAKTTCRQGYMVPQCNGYKPVAAESSIPAPATLVDDIAAAHASLTKPSTAPDLNCRPTNHGLSCQPVR
jgi:hypothetical protein